MKLINFENPHRRKHFEFFLNFSHPHFNICANVDITPMYRAVKKASLPFMPSVVWLVSTVANEIPEFRQRIRGQQVVEHETVHPSFTINTDVADVFSFCEVSYEPNYSLFVKKAFEKITQLKQNPSLEDEPGRDDYLYLSSLPWVSFTGIQHAMQYHPHDSVPRIVWGKFFEENGRIKMPVSVQAHHAVVDGRHSGLFFEKFEQGCQQPGSWM